MNFSLIYEGKEFTFATHGVGDGVANTMKVDGSFYELEVLEHIRDRYLLHGTILDIGANIGTHTVYFAEYLNAQLVCGFEPHPVTFELLERNTAQYSHVDLFNVACGDRQGSVGLIDCPALCDTEVDEGGRGTTMIKIDDLPIDNVTMIKIDVERHELQVLQGACGTIDRYHPVIFVECSGYEYLMPIFNLLKGMGYRLDNILGWMVHEFTYEGS